MRLLARGKPMKEIAAELRITARTVAFHKYKTMRALGLDSSAALVGYAVKNHMLGEGGVPFAPAPDGKEALVYASHE